VLTQALQHLNDVLKSLEPVNQFLGAPGSSVLLQELANAQTSSDSSISAHSMPLLHGLSAVHSCVNVFTHICKVGQVYIMLQLSGIIRHLRIVHLRSNQISNRIGRIYRLTLWTCESAICV